VYDDCHDCPDGSYCPTGVDAIPCPANYYCDPTISVTVPQACGLGAISANGSVSSDNCTCAAPYYGSGGDTDCNVCPLGSYCSGGGDTIDCPLSYYCPLGSSVPLTCGDNRTTVAANSGSSSDCICMVGLFGGTGANQVCTICTVGYYCPDGISEVTCPADYYCPEGTIEPISCNDIGNNNDRISSIGSNSSNDCQCQPGLVGDNAANTTCYACAASYYCSGGDTEVVCPPNYYCPEGTDVPLSCGDDRVSLEGSWDASSCNCSSGSFGEFGANLPCEICEAGYYCPTSTPITCPLSYYCPSAVAVPIACGDNRTTVAANSGSSSDCICSEGLYGATGANQVCTICTVGYYCPDGISEVTCPADYYCPAGSGVPQSCNGIGNDNDGTRQSSGGSYSDDDCHCRPGAVGINGANITCAICAAGYYCSGGTAQVICPANSYCDSGSAAPVSCGTNRISLEGSDDYLSCNCSATLFGPNGPNLPCTSCTAGYYCPASTVIPIDCPVSYYCTTGVSVPMTCGANRTAAINSDSSDDCICSEGLYGATGITGMCSVCVAGSYCDNGSGQVCPPSYYCPLGSVVPISCNGIGNDNDGTRESNAGSDSVDDCYCRAGFIGVNGVNQTCSTCAAGSYCSGGTSQESCPPNHYCPEGSGQPIPCGTNRVSIAGSSDDSGCSCDNGLFGAFGANITCTECVPGYYCPTPTVVPSDCPLSYYCPSGSSVPQSCGANRTTSYTNSGASSDCVCIDGTVGATGANQACVTCAPGSSCNGTSEVICPMSYYCPSGSSEPIACATNRTSLAGSDAEEDCFCGVAFYSNATTDICYPCPFGMSTNASSNGVAIGAVSVSQCGCNIGYYGNFTDGCTGMGTRYTYINELLSLVFLIPLSCDDN
jgi:hypothetical protein